MKATAKFLTAKELKVFEAQFQSLKIFPGFKLDNIFTHRTRENYAVTRQIPEVL